MNRLRLALQGFESLAMSMAVTQDEAISDAAEAWLRNEVCPVVEELCQIRGFQAATRWSLDHLCVAEPTAETRLLQRAENALVRHAEAVELAVARIRGAAPGESDANLSDLNVEQLELLAGKPWVQLVSAHDFFHPDDNLFLRTPNHELTRAFRSQERRLPLGDYVGRYLLARVDFWKNLATTLEQAVSRRLPSTDADDFDVRNRIFENRIRLDGAARELADAIQSSDFRRREACAALVQIYAAYAPRPNLAWLGFTPDIWETSAPRTRTCVRRPSDVSVVDRLAPGEYRQLGAIRRSVCDPAVLRQVAAALQEVAGFYEVPESPDDLIEWASDRARLVLVDRSPRQVFWEGRVVGGDSWDNASAAWNFLWTLAVHPGRTIDKANLGDCNARSRRNRLSEKLAECQELDQLIVTVPNQGYQLDLLVDDLIMLQDNGLGQLELFSR